MTRSASARDSVTKLLKERLGPGVREAEPMRAHTTLQIGGPADWYLDAKTPDQVVAALGAAAEAGVSPFVLGGGSNLLVSDEGFRGLVVHVACDGVRFMKKNLPFQPDG